MKLLPKHPDIGWTPFAWLVYLAPMFFFVNSNTDRWRIGLLLAVTAVFLVLYFRVYWTHGRKQLLAILMIAGLAVCYTPVNQGATTFFIYTSAFFGMFFPRRTVVAAIGALMAVLGLEIWLFDLHPVSWIPAAVFTPLIGAINLHFSEAGRANARLRLAQDELEMLAKMDERERIARDLHDLLGHTLSVVTLKSELAGRLLSQPSGADNQERLRTELADIETLSRRAMSEVRGSVTGYRAHRMQTELAKARMALAAAQIHLELETGPYDLTSAQETVAAHALREAVTNVIRHARALQCTIRLRTQAQGGFALEVEDDGRGIRREPGSGLNGMHERVEQIGGTLSISDARAKSILGKGTIVRLTIPRVQTDASPTSISA